MFVHQMADVYMSPTKVAIFIWFELGTTSTPSTGLHPHALGLSYIQEIETNIFLINANNIICLLK